ncbi:MAG: hypothetical protein UHN88_07540 [Eubacterium sp.]|nr:hypothetical protein [Eubacterium sp.]
MDNILTFLASWLGVILCAVFLVLGFIISIKGSAKGDERRFETTNDHYLITRKFTAVILAILFPIIAAVVCFVLGYLPFAKVKTLTPIFVIIQAAIGVIAGIVTIVLLCRAIRFHILVNGNDVSVTPAIGKTYQTSFTEVRTLKGVKENDRVVSLTARTNNHRRFTVTEGMKNHEIFFTYAPDKVPMPNLTKKKAG